MVVTSKEIVPINDHKMQLVPLPTYSVFHVKQHVALEYNKVVV